MDSLQEQGLPEVFISEKVRMPKVIQDWNIDINGWHEANALFTGVHNEIDKIQKEGIESYIGKFFYVGSSLVLPVECETNNPRRIDGLEKLWSGFLKKKINEIKTVLDVGSGRGQAGVWFSTAHVNYVGIDISLSSLGFSIALLSCFKFIRPDCPVPEYRQMLMEDLKFKDKSFDLVFSSHSLEHAHNLQKTISEQCRVGKELCGVVAKPREVEEGEHLYKISKSVLESYLERYCSSFNVEVLEEEIIFYAMAR